MRCSRLVSRIVVVTALVPVLAGISARVHAAGVSVTESGGATLLNEAGPTSDTYTIVLDTLPAADVEILVQPDAQTDLGAGAGAALLLEFTAANWNVEQSVSVTAVDDVVVEGSHTSTITHAATSGDPDYDGIAIVSVIAQITDNDAAGVTIVESGGSTTVMEAGPTSDSYEIVLTSRPTANVTITIQPDAQTDVGMGAGAPNTVSFTPGSWSFPRLVVVTAVNDVTAEGPHTSTITHSTASADPTYNGIAIANVVANIIDNDAAGVTIAQSAGSTDVSEAGPTTDSYTIVLDKQPAANVTITVSIDGQLNLGSGPGTAVAITFTTANWNVARQINVTAVDDVFSEGPHTSTITHSAASGDAGYNGIAIPNVVVQITDNDSIGVRIVESGGSTSVSEIGPTSDTYTVVLDSPPTANVTVTVRPDVQTDLGAGAGTLITLIFTPGNWNVAQTVTVTAVDDAIAEGAHTSTITHTAASADPDYNGIAVVSVTANVTDNDTVGVAITQSGGSTNVNETGPTADTYTVVLNSQPTASVTVTVDPDTQTNLGTGAGAVVVLTFTTANWNVAQTITVTAVDDSSVEGPHTSTITHTAASADTNYNGIAIGNVVANVTDNDTAGVTVTQSGGSTDVNEAGPTSDTYTLVLTSLPTANVVITVDPDTETDLGGGAGAAIVLTFTTANWNVAQTVTVAAVNDAIAEGGHTSTITHTAASGDPNYNGIAVVSVTASITDNDTAGVTIAQSGGSTDVSEVGPTSDTYTVVLNSQPTVDVVITVDPDAQTDLGAGAGSVITLSFTTANWNAAQSVTVTAVDDVAPEGPHTSTITHTTSSGDANYNGIAIVNVNANITDNDTPGVILVQSAGSTEVSEAGPGSDTYTVVLSTLPTANVTITVDPDTQTNLGAGAGVPIVLVFTTGNWNSAQTVTVTAVDDAIAEGNHTSTITHSAASADPDYNWIAIANLVAQITDNDTAGITVTQSGGSTDVDEAGPTSDTYTVVLDSQPTADVTITVDPDAQTDLGAGAGAVIVLTFTAGNWNAAQTVTVTAVNDASVEGSHTSTITHTAASGDPNYNGIAVAGVTANITDNDTAGVTVTQSGGSTNVDEAGPTSDTYTVVLDSQPTADVTITVDPDTQTDLGAGAGAVIVLTFTAGNWNVAQTVTVTAVNDAVAEGGHTSTITHVAASGDTNYSGIAITNVTANITDNDTAGVTITESGGATNVNEAGPTSDTYTLVLNSQPTADVVITVDPDTQTNLGSGAGAVITITFTSANWNVARTVTVTAVNDLVAEGPHTSTITHAAASGDANYNGIAIANVTANITDNDTAGVIIVESGGSTNVNEAGPTSDTYTLRLASQPTANVVITVDPDMQTTVGAGAGAVITRTFTAANWNVTQTVTVTAVNDLVAEGAHTSIIMHTAASADPNYNGIAIANVTANITDNDTAGVTITQSGGSTNVNETGPTSDTYTVVLNTQPTADVVISVDPDVQTDLGSGAGAVITLTFTAGNWNAAQTVTVTAVDDAAWEGPHTSTITHTAASADAQYNGIAIANVTASVIDNDLPGVTVSQTGGSTAVSEAGPTSDTYMMVFDSPPTADVVVTVDPDMQTDLGSGAGVAITLTFTAGNWNVPQTVTVTAVDDMVSEGPHTSTITHTAASGDASYNGIAIANITASITDNDSAGVSITQSGGSTAVSEAGPTADTYTVVLNTLPTASVTLTVDPDNQTDVGAGAGAAIVLTFTTGNWSVAQTVTVTAVDDLVAEGNHTSTIAHTAASGDTNYNGIAIANVTANITDNDTAGVTITQSGGSTDVSEVGPTSDTYTLVLNSQPTANVVVTVDPDTQTNLGSGAGAVITLTFTTANWNVAQTVTVTGVDDLIAEGNHTSTITHSAASGDANYNGIAIGSVTANLTDNDTAGVTLVESGGSTHVNETGPTSDSYTIVLNTQPTADVNIAVDPDMQTDLGAGAGAAVTLVFTSANWNTPRTVTVTAVDDATGEGPHTSTITHTAASADSVYNGFAIPSVTATIVDNDVPGVTVVESGGSTSVNEAGPTSDTYTIVFDSPPTADVTIQVDPDAQTDVGGGAGVPITLTFMPGNWNVPRTVVVTAVDDLVLEGPHTSTITHTAVSADPDYNGIAIVSVTANITDNDTAGVSLIETGGSTSIDETGPTSDTYSIVLNTQPTASVTITVDPDSQTDLGAGAGAAIALNFTTGNWNVAQTVTVTAVDDLVAEGMHTSTITHAAASGDTNYNGIAIANVTAGITDNDSAGVTITQSGGSTDVSENGPTSDAYTVVLDSQPTANVIITIDPDTQTDLGAGAGAVITLTFTAGNWSVAQTVTVTAVDDQVAEGGHTSVITHAAASGDTHYNGIAIANVTANITDNDTAGVTFTQSGGSTDVDEAGPTSDTFTIVLDTQPTSNVVITVDPDSQADLGSGVGVAITLTFTAGNWNIAQTLTVTAVDDLVAEGAHTSVIAHTAASGDANYNGIAIANVIANITDNDTAGVTITQTGGSTDVNETGPTSDSYTVVLNTQPTADVTITVDPDAQTDLGAGAGAVITFTLTPINWNVPRTVTVTAVDDLVPEGPHVSVITHTAASGDTNYSGIAIADVTANITDNDTAGVTITESGGATMANEPGLASDTYTVVLNTPPTADVTISVDPDAQTRVGAGAGVPITLTFTPANWNVAQTVLVTAVDDMVIEGDHTSTITHTAASADPDYNGIAIASVTVYIADNDSVPGGGGGPGMGPDRPRAYSQIVTIQQDTAVLITLTGSGVSGSDLAYYVVSRPAHGTLTGDAPYLTYTPAPGWSGVDAFIFIVADGHSSSDLADVIIEVRPVPPPLAGVAQDITVEQDQPVTITLAAVNGDVADPPVFEIVEPPQHGTLEGAPPELTFRPESGFVGIDRFSFIVRDAQSTSEPAEVTITVVARPEEATRLIARAGNDVETDLDQLVRFDATGSRIENDAGELAAGRIVHYAWDFDAADGINDDATGQVVQWSFGRAGVYIVTLTITDDQGRSAQDTLTCTVLEEQVEGDPPVPPRLGLCGAMDMVSLLGLAQGLMGLRLMRRQSWSGLPSINPRRSGRRDCSRR